MTGSIYVTAAWDGGRIQLNTDIPSLFFLWIQISTGTARDTNHFILIALFGKPTISSPQNMSKYIS